MSRSCDPSPVLGALGAALIGLTLAAPPAAAQWSSDPAAPLALVQSSTSEVLEEIVPAPNGKTWVVWMQAPDKVRVQRLDGQGQALLGPFGNLVVGAPDHPVASVLDVALLESGNLLVITRMENDCESYASPRTIDATLVAPSGQVLWGPQTVITEDCTVEPFGSPSYFTLAVETLTVLPTAGDACLLGFVRYRGTYSGSFRDALVLGLDGDGSTLWSLTLPDGTYNGWFDGALGMAASGDDALVVYDDGWTSYAYRIAPDQDGAILWSRTLDTAPGGADGLQLAGPDGAGGALLTLEEFDSGWSTVALEFQRLDGDGDLVFPEPSQPYAGAGPLLDEMGFDLHPDPIGVTVAMGVDDPAAAGEQLRVQRLGLDGQRLWGDTGVLVTELAPDDDITQTMVMASGTSALVFWREAGVTAGGAIRGARIDQTGAVDIAPFTVATSAAAGGTIHQTRSTAGEALLAWGRTIAPGNVDLFGQNVTCDGELGPLVPGAAFHDLGLGLAGAAGLPQLSGTGSLCPCTPTTLTLTGGAPLTQAVFVMGLSAWFAPFKGGTLVPSPDLQVHGLSTDAQGEFLLTANMPAQAVPGLEFWVQYWLLDATGPKGFTASNGLSFVMP